MLPTHSTHCSLQYGVETSFRSIQVARYGLILELVVKVIQVTSEFDDVLE